MSAFIKYLKESYGITPTSELGLIDNTPQSAIGAYDKYKKSEKERLNSKDDRE